MPASAPVVLAEPVGTVCGKETPSAVSGTTLIVPSGSLMNKRDRRSVTVAENALLAFDAAAGQVMTIRNRLL